MKIKYGFLIILTVFVLLFSACDWLFENNDNNENPPVTGNPPGDNFEYVVGTTLLQTKWGITDVYETKMPENSRFGCVGVAVAQIMRYHKYPKWGKGLSEEYTTRNGVNVQSVNFNEVFFDWDNTLDTYLEIDSGTNLQRATIAEIYRNIAIGIKMNFGFNGEGGGVDSGPLGRGLTAFFNYDKSLQSLYRSYYNNSMWEAIIRAQLDAGLPVLYSGSNIDNSSNHAFVIDGYDNSGKFHINWGWNGSRDGWYSLNALNPGDYDFNYGNVIWINIKPEKGGEGSNEMALLAFTPEATSVNQNKQFNVNVQLRSAGFFSGGNIGAALVANNGSILDIVGMNSRATSSFNSLDPAGYRTVNISCYVPETIATGKQCLRIVLKPEGKEWQLVTLSAINNNIPNAFDLIVNPYIGINPGGGYGLSLEKFSIIDNIVSVSSGDTFSVLVRTRKLGEQAFSGGQLGVALVANDGSIEVIREMNWSLQNPGAEYREQIINNCSVPGDVAQGHYQLQIVVRPTGGEWRIATLALPDVPNSIDFEVKY